MEGNKEKLRLKDLVFWKQVLIKMLK